MRKVIIFVCLVLVVTLSACNNSEVSSENTQNKSENNTEQNSENNQQENSKDDGVTESENASEDNSFSETSNNDEDSSEATKESESNGILTQPGETVKENDYTVELLKIKELNETINMDPLTVNLESVKLLKFKEMNNHFKQDLAAMSGKDIGEEVTYIQIYYHSENTSEKKISWNALTNIVTDQKEQIDVIMNDILTNDADYTSDFLGQVQKEHLEGLILTKPDISSVRLIFSDVRDYETYDVLAEDEEVEVAF